MLKGCGLYHSLSYGGFKVNLKLIRKDAKSSLKNKYFKFFLLSLISFFMSIEIVMVFEEPFNIMNILRLSYIMVLIGIFIKPFYITALKRIYLTGDIGSFHFIKKSCYVKITAAFLIRRIIIFIGLLLFLIPGIYIIIKYIFLPYLIADNPELELKEMFVMANALTKGKKLLVLRFIISFIPMYFAGLLCFGIGVLFVNPYFEMCLKEFYIKISLDK